MNVGDVVTIDFEGEDHTGQIERIERGWIFATMVIDPELDYGTQSARLSPYQIVCVPASRVRPL